MGGVGGCLDTGFRKNSPWSQIRFHPNVQLFCFEISISQNSEAKRNVQKSHVLTGRDRIEENSISYGVGGWWLIFIYAPNGNVSVATFHIPDGCLPFLYTSAFWLFSSTFSSSFFSSSEEPFSFSPVFQLPCLSRKIDGDIIITRSNHADRLTLLMLTYF